MVLKPRPHPVWIHRKFTGALMALAGHGFDLVGISLFGPRPLEAVHLEFRDGLSVLYGLNGSGKTTILREAEGVLRGIGPGRAGGVSSEMSCLHVRISCLQEDPSLFERSVFESSLAEAILDAGDAAEALTHSTRLDCWQWLLNRCLHQELDQDWIWNEKLLAHQEEITFCLAPTGSSDNPAWRFYLSARLLGAEWVALDDAIEKRSLMINEILASAALTEPVDFGNSPVAGFGETPWNRLADGKNLRENPIPQWDQQFPFPISLLGEVRTSPVHVISDKGSIESTQQVTNSLLISLAEENGEIIEIADETETRLNPQFMNAAQRIEDDANAFLELTGPHLFRLELELKSPHEWFVGEIPEWTAISNDGMAMGIGRLSGAELRWALAALQWATSGLDTSRPQIFLIDEPERGLHRLREQELPRMLRNLCKRSLNLMVLAASHAPSFLDVRVGAALHHVSRVPGTPTVLRPIDLGTSALMTSSAESLGLAPSDLLQLTRIFVLVEGVHDEIVIEVTLGEDIRRAGGRVIPINGASHARSIADARILFDATEASIVFVIDNVISEQALEIWGKATEEYKEGQRKAAKSTLSSLLRLGSGGEVLWLQALGERAIDANVIHRIKPFGMSKRDIVCYLPASAFKLSKSWPELEADYDRARSAGLTNENFKSWLKKMRGADFSKNLVEKAANSMPSPLPREFTELSMTVQGLGILGPVDDLETSLELP